jgi:hypothetical protein
MRSFFNILPNLVTDKHYYKNFNGGGNFRLMEAGIATTSNQKVTVNAGLMEAVALPAFVNQIGNIYKKNENPVDTPAKPIHRPTETIHGPPP